MKQLLRLAVRLYPARWRDRYGEEFEQLLADVGPSWSALLNTARGGAMARSRSLSLDPIRSRPAASAVVALLLVLPTAILVVAAILKYVAGLPGPFDALEPAMTPIVTHPIGETALVLAPYVGLLLTLLPVSRVTVAWHEGRLTASLRLATPALNLLVAVVCTALIVFMGLYWVAENL